MSREEFEYETTHKGEDYIVYLTYEQVCTRRGTFSSAALDPEEYYGTFAARDIELDYVMKRVQDDNDWVWEDCEVYPDDIVDEAIGELKYSF